MIPRYSRPEMSAIWSDENRFKIMLEVELLAAEAMAKDSIVPISAINEIRRKAKIDVNKIAEIEKTVKHDVISFLTQIAQSVGPKARFLHLGMTSSDVLDTALGVQLAKSCDLLLKGIDALTATTKKLAIKYKFTPTMGRTHGVHAEPTTFGLKVLGWYSQMLRARSIIETTKDYVSYGKISGAVGTFAHLNPKVEEYVCKKLGLKAEMVSTQIVPRDRHAVYLCRIAIVGSLLERIALEIRHLQRTEVLEAEEPFSEGQKGSSAMPHKRNPIISENICGLARLLRGYVTTGIENVALWHERDISHSSAERIILPDAAIALDYMLYRTNYMLSDLRVYPENMLSNLRKSEDTIFSGALLLAIVDKGKSREDAYKITQCAAFEARESKKSLADVVASDTQITKLLKKDEIRKCFSLEKHLANVDYIFKRTLKKHS